MGKDPRCVVKVREEFGYGEDAYLAAFDSGHQLHCLDILRKETHKDYYFPQGIDVIAAVRWKNHVGHCLEALRQHLMCHATTELTTFMWVENRRDMQPDFGSKLQCHDYEDIIKFVQDTGVVKDNYSDLRIYFMPPPEDTFREPNLAPELLPPGLEILESRHDAVFAESILYWQKTGKIPFGNAEGILKLYSETGNFTDVLNVL
ncbi:hypothetical protein HBH70_220500 [Parastagonospora nodorum]|nr:hypothetical protein HBI74_234510 [Parastagonospora nodorum]KAH5128016.1 hypothetical protein HBH70_220500 [Parastagonospora nodorum]KAH5398028.1 hypothetical protein HBI47_208040 [Parastagonospora nodorum]KAH5648716.1 hypothetical protein HBI51_100450 [Parastagonospora nodorum]KAH6027084.1 hypothetical protein HBI54_237940 [Parastagonospora nodorum]